eukprot:4659266-Amphidinium_carterae.1
MAFILPKLTWCADVPCENALFTCVLRTPFSWVSHIWEGLPVRSGKRKKGVFQEDALNTGMDILKADLDTGSVVFIHRGSCLQE